MIDFIREVKTLSGDSLFTLCFFGICALYVIGNVISDIFKSFKRK